MKEQFSQSHQLIVDRLHKQGYTDLHQGVQLFANQYDKYWSVSINYNGTGIHIDKSEIDEEELIGDELIKVCKSWDYVS